ncbi:DUF6602 domain-containing protein [Streptomyces ipomoeae]|uniref:DUF6602 domain-containing protein n=1 Tax=Streptomyces ipomoeae TaxID=103232 RepID=UPI000662B01A|nr:DUF6602 domain-containing protein [Streptomyces ipomoeae]MDX2694428.1 hypothetical protein [Streptomyces ipomoeae]MDX2837914.1 hypothetical protein [Streptomyces ipomoeae]
MDDNHLAGVLHSVAMRMRADFRQSQLFQHRGEAGTNRELLVRDFLASQLPGHVKAIHSAEIITASGEVSPQCDIVITDRSTPPLTDLQGYRIVPNECVYGVVEVKTTLDREKLLDACEKVRKAKKLAKTAYYPTPGFQRTRTAYGRTYPYTPTVGMIFAFDSIDLVTLGEHFIGWCKEREPEHRPDSIWVLGKGYYVWTNPATGFVNPTPEPGSGMIAMEPWHDEDVLLPLVLHLNQHFATAWMPPLRLFDYAGQHPLGVSKHLWTELPAPPTE